MSGTGRPLVVMLTSRFPYGTAENFIESELAAWTASGVDLLLVPEKNDTPDSTTRPLPAGVQLDTRLTRRWASPLWRALSMIDAVTDPVLYRELAGLRQLGSLDPRTTLFVARSAVQIAMVRRMIRRIARERHGIDVVYAYWLSVSAVAGALERRRGTVAHAVARAHGTDLYEERRSSGHSPMTRQITGDLDLLSTVSKDGEDYAVSHYGFAPQRVETHRLGVAIPDRDQWPEPTGQGSLTILSVSSMTPVKRLDLVVDTLVALRSAAPELRLRWIHVGQGPLRPAIEQRIATELHPAGVSSELLGQIDHEALMAWYRGQQLDLIINTSSSEGIPVSIMEALARGVPAVATDVGAVHEVVEPDWLVPAEADGDQIAGRILSLMDRIKDPRVRSEAAEGVARNFDSAVNHRAFVGRLVDLAGQP